MRNAKITVLVGVSAQAGTFTEEIVREVGRNTERPVIFPLSNPTSKSEATPEDILRWTEGRALVATGSPFAPVEINGRPVPISQCNNSFVFPGIALGTLVSQASRVSNGMIMAAAKALAGLSPAIARPDGALLPAVSESRKVALAVAEAVGKAAIAEGLSDLGDSTCLIEDLHAYVWDPVYLPYERVD